MPGEPQDVNVLAAGSKRSLVYTCGQGAEKLHQCVAILELRPCLWEILPASVVVVDFSKTVHFSLGVIELGHLLRVQAAGK